MTAERDSVPSARSVEMGVPTRRKSPAKKSKRRSIEELAAEANGIIKAKSGWGEASTAVLVGQYFLLHTIVYGVEPSELCDEKEFLGALSAAKAFAAKAGGVASAADVVRWTFAREKSRRAKRPGDFRVKWRYQFSTSVLTDYRVETVGRAARG